MNTMPTFRRGRRKYTPGAKRRFFYRQSNQNKTFVDRGGGWCALIGTFLLILIPLLVYIYIETRRFHTFEALMEVSNSEIVELPPAKDEMIKSGHVVHGSSKNIKSSVFDPALGIRIDNALTLNRNTEYCQWQEIRSESCNTCSRTVRNEDGTTETENYDCDCVAQYDYIKGWQPFLINSFFFDQPAAHYNPQRDPLPSSLFVANDALVSFTNSSRGDTAEAYLSPEILESRVRGSRTRNVKWVYNGIPKPPPFWKRWIPDRSRYEDVSSLEYLVRSLRSSDERFTYVGDGYFFSPHESSTMEQLMKMFGEYIEGSLFDWQIGDIFPSCKPGDIRLKYSVQDPQTISVLGEATTTSMSSHPDTMVVQPFKSSNGFKVGYVHDGIVSATEIIESENSRSRMFAAISRLLGICWAYFASREICFIAGYDFRKSSALKQMMMTVCLWSILTGTILSRIFGPSFDSNLLSSVSIILLVILSRHPLLPVKSKRIVEEEDDSPWNDNTESCER